MSGIYGFTYRISDEHIHAEALAGLAYWNRIYGREASNDWLLGPSGIGCHIEHFSQDFPYGGPILELEGRPAVVDALLYNRDELMEILHLQSSGRLSDEELLLILIREKGWQALRLVNGDFAGAVYDPAAREWTFFRDHLGVRPLFCYADDDLIACSTDLRGLAALPNADLELNEMLLYTTLRGANPLTMTETEFRRIRCVAPASILRLRMTDRGVESDEEFYWKLGEQKIRLDSDAEYQARLRSLVTDAVNCRCDAISGLLGAELSGGLDSSIIDILISCHGRDCVFYSWSYSPSVIPITDERDERNIVDQICRQEQITCRYRLPSDGFTFESRGEWLLPYYADTPKLSYGSSWMKSQGANVVFSGHGGDEGISHRGRRFELWHAGEYAAYFRFYRNDFRGKPLGTLRAFRTGLLDAMRDEKQCRNFLRHAPPYVQIFRPEFHERMNARYRAKPFTFNYDPKVFILQGGTRPRMDNAAYQGALNGVRYLFPYVDHRVMDFAVSIPRSQFITPTQNRAVFRNAFRDLMPDSLFQVSLKQTVSTSSLPDDPRQAEHHKAIVNKLLQDLDRDLWSDYLDLDQLEVVLRTHDGSLGGIGSVDALMTILSRYIRVQEIQQNAKKWREHDALGKTV